MSLKKKSKSLGHLTGLGSPNFGSPRMKKQISQKNFNAERLRVLNHGYGAPEVAAHQTGNGNGDDGRFDFLVDCGSSATVNLTFGKSPFLFQSQQFRVRPNQVKRSK